jgi:hypothetical protein
MDKQIVGGLIPLLILLVVVPHVYAESDSKRASDGFNDGSSAARSDISFNPACDPTGAHTSDGQHTSTYCNAWTSGYTSTWNSQHTNTPDTFIQRQDQSQKQSQSGICIALVCKQTQSGSQGADQGQTQGNGQ